MYGAVSVPEPQDERISVGGLKFPNRLGMAAGFDKDGMAIQGIAKLGLGFIELGCVTPRPQPGNRFPRLFRLRKDLALINRLGFNNCGAQALADRLGQADNHVKIPLGVNIGKNWDTPLRDAVDDYVECLDTLTYSVDFVTINISSPNTLGLNRLQERDHVVPLLDRIVERREATSSVQSRVSIFVKISPDLDEDSLESLCVSIRESGCDGIIATNTTTERRNLLDKQGSEAGGLSGKPLFPLAVQTVSAVRSILGSGFPVIGCGGIWDRTSALEMLDAGADLIQLYSALIYRGPRCIAEIVQATTDIDKGHTK